MNLTLERIESRDDGIFGFLDDEDGNPIAKTLEHAFPGKNGAYQAKIPVGTYSCHRRRSPKFGYDVFELIDVPGHDFIEIHCGNFNADSDGCILLGDSIEESQRTGAQFITNSRETFARFMRLQQGVDEFSLIVQ